MKRYRITLDTMSAVNKFVEIATRYKDFKIKLTDGEDYTVNGKSLLGAAYTIEWNKIYCLVPEDCDIYNDIEEFIIEEDE